MSRLRAAAIAVSLALAPTAAASAQDRQTADDRLLRLFARNEAKHVASRRNLVEILRREPNFWIELQSVAARLKTEPAWLLNIMASESLFKPSARNSLPGQTASGLLQFIEATARGMGTTTEAIRRMSPVEQLRLVEKYLAPFRGRLGSLADVYLAVFRGVVIEGRDTVVVVDSGKEQRIYALNRSLDIDKDGRITKGELSLAALSIGRFLPAPARTTHVKKSKVSQTAKTASENEEDQSSSYPNQNFARLSPASEDLDSETTRKTRSIYIRREKLR